MAKELSETGKTWLDLVVRGVERAQEEYVRSIVEMHTQHNYSVTSIADYLGVSRSTIHRIIDENSRL
jgi:DNA invertase Pin-like site-specific DNA recombinase